VYVREGVLESECSEKRGHSSRQSVKVEFTNDREVEKEEIVLQIGGICFFIELSNQITE